jgi:hypothetical protein
MEEDEMGRMCSICGRNTKFVCHFGQMYKGVCLGVLDVGKRIIVKWFVKK